MKYRLMPCVILAVLAVLATSAYAGDTNLLNFGRSPKVSAKAEPPSGSGIIDLLKQNGYIEVSGFAPLYPADLTATVSGSVEVGWIFKKPLDRKWFIDIMKVRGEDAVGGSVSFNKWENDNNFRFGGYLRKPTAEGGHRSPSFYVRYAVGF